MRDLSMHIMDIVQNSVKANSSLIEIIVEEKIFLNKLIITIKDDGCGMSEEFLQQVRDPFKTSRTTRKVGLGIPMLEQTCLLSNGKLAIYSVVGKGTTIEAIMEYNHIDRPPLGDISNSIFLTLIMNENSNFIYRHIVNENIFEINTIEIKEILDGESLNNPDISNWLKTTIIEGIKDLYSF